MHPNLRLFSLYRLVTLVLSFLGTFLNLVLAVHILALWYSFRWEAESSECEWLADKWRVLGFNVFWILFSSYFSAAAAISAVGFAGVIKNRTSLVRFYRDYCIADFAFCAAFSTFVVFAAFQTPARIGICEEFARYSELVSRVIGINVENGELWLSSATVGLAALLFAVIIVRLHILFAMASYYSGLSRCSRTCCTSHHCNRSSSDEKRIFLLPASPEEGIKLVYVSVKLSHGVWSKAKETWLSETVPIPSASQQGVVPQYHHMRHSRRHSRVSSAVINLNNNSNRPAPIFLRVYPEEGLLPMDRDYVKV